jgi:hypothetical protein
MLLNDKVEDFVAVTVQVPEVVELIIPLEVTWHVPELLSVI